MESKVIFSKKRSLNLKGNLISLTEPIVMGILNVTPDSFFDGGRYQKINDVENQIRKMIAEDVDIIDVGAFSSRPGVQIISQEDEWQRLFPVLELIAKKFPDSIVSVDTFRAEIARRAVENYSVAIINDISAGELDAEMFSMIARLQVPYIIMHMRGTPQNMQKNTTYKHLLKEILNFFAKKNQALRLAGVKDVIIDPGFGFGKSLAQNYEILTKLDVFRMLEIPLLAGISRKSMLWKLLDVTPDKALNATTAAHMVALQKGADILRVHDVKEAKQVIKIFQMTNDAN